MLRLHALQHGYIVLTRRSPVGRVLVMRDGVFVAGDQRVGENDAARRESALGFLRLAVIAPSGRVADLVGADAKVVDLADEGGLRGLVAVGALEGNAADEDVDGEGVAVEGESGT